jgi:hypothetical protein
MVDGHEGSWPSTRTDGFGLSVCTRFVLSNDMLNILLNNATASSTDVERAFSRGGLTVSRMRHSLSDASVRAAAVVGSWCDYAAVIPRKELINIFNDKNKRPKGSGGDTEEGNAPEPVEITIID